MSPTNKAIARAAGYRIDKSLQVATMEWWYYWKDDILDDCPSYERFATEQEAWDDCCKANGLTHE